MDEKTLKPLLQDFKARAEEFAKVIQQPARSNAIQYQLGEGGGDNKLRDIHEQILRAVKSIDSYLR
jgi:hypothetical protein